MSYSATAEDWFALLGVSEVLPAVFNGEVTLGETQAALALARERWPGTNEDYVAIVDGIGQSLGEVASAILAQNRALAALRNSIGSIEQTVPEDFPGAFISNPPSPVDRLLTQAERDLLGRINRELEDLVAELDSWGSDLEDEADEAEQEANEEVEP